MKYKSLDKSILVRKTKLVTTIGPSSEIPAVFPKMFENGSTCVRMNFSHGDYAEHGGRIAAAKKLTNERHLPITLLLDTKGPEIRTGNFVNDALDVEKGKIYKIYSKKPFIGNSEEFYIDYKQLPNDVKEGSLIYLDDGKLRLKVISTNPEISCVTVQALNNHKIKNRRGVNLPGTNLSLSFLSKKDKEDLVFGCENKVHYVAASFVRNAKDVKEIRKFLNKNGGNDIKIISKIECQEAVEKFDEILKLSDGIMVARGDLGIEVPFELVPNFEKTFVRKCIIARKPVIVATQMLDSMTKNPAPTRAEVTDVFWAVDLGTSATMLSGESANGDYPLEATNAMAKIALQAETEITHNFIKEVAMKKWPKTSRALAKKVLNGEFNTLVAHEPSYDLVSSIASMHLPLNIIALTNDLRKLCFFGIQYGVKACYSDIKNFDKTEITKIVKNMDTIEEEGLKIAYLNSDGTIC
ncbi:hypothetical protein ASO20_02350 [Mycoplasma sp. (ex Biomphalaria glabrata)]|nr:pyruvate kinase [Mycoplasma sp. (ex Biomphalaria glabrata)]ALV23476.1 hypothetical protein ASO20_02350 [Mycoplasma sp. (ex Biomphalaria glabrata)]